MAGYCVITRRNASVLHSVFPLQSFFDNTQLVNALLQQNPASLIVNPVTAQVTGRVVGLHPDSQCPVALTLRGPSGSVPLVLTPGQIFRGAVDNGFTALEWGLPFGWLGGGLAKLVVADADDAVLDWPKVQREVLLQRFRMQITADASPTTTPNPWVASLPLRFPWKNGYRYNTAAPTAPIPQTGIADIAAVPSRLLMRLRVGNLAAPATMRLLFRGIDDFDLGSDGTTIAYTDLAGIDVTWPQASGTSAPYPVLEARDGLQLAARGDSMVLTLSDLGNAALTSQYVDVLSYGLI